MAAFAVLCITVFTQSVYVKAMMNDSALCIVCYRLRYLRCCASILGLNLSIISQTFDYTLETSYFYEVQNLNIWKRFQTSNKVMYLYKNLLLPESFNDVFLLSWDVHKYNTRLPMNSFQVVRKQITVKLSEAYPQDYVNELTI